MFSFWIVNFRGELAALTAACFWAISSIVYSRIGQQISPLWLNLIKGMIGITLLVLTLFFSTNSVPVIAPFPLGLLLLSGVLGIGFGDTFYFESLKYLGARRALLLEALAPPLSAVLALVFLQEKLSSISWLGIGLTVGGVSWVMSERLPAVSRPDKHRFMTANHLDPLALQRGVSAGLLAVLGQSSGAVLSRMALTQSDISPLFSTLVRLGAGVLVLAIWAATQQSLSSSNPESIGFKANSWSVLGAIAVAAFLGTYLGIWLQQTAFKFTAVGIAQTLTSTSPLFVLPIAACLGEAISFRAVLGVLLALSGVWLLVAGPKPILF